MSELVRRFDLFDDFNRLYGDWFGGNLTTPSREGWMPAVDIRTDNGDYLIELEVPGFQPEQVEVSVQDNVLTIKGQREDEETTSKEGYVRRERRSGQFLRRFNLPNHASGDDINASVKDGVLTLRVPQVTQQEPEKIQVD
jgi:HSP20 family protein